MKTLTVRLSAEHVADLDRIAERMGTSRQRVLAAILESNIDVLKLLHTRHISIHYLRDEIMEAVSHCLSSDKQLRISGA